MVTEPSYLLFPLVTDAPFSDRLIIVDAVDLAVVGGSSECEEGKGDKDC